MGFKHHPSYDSGEYTERNKGKYENCKRVRHTFDAHVGGGETRVQSVRHKH